jgi:hypothetical protein
MNQLRNWSFRVGAALVIAFNVLVVLSVSVPAYGQSSYCHTGNNPPPCKTTVACSKARKPACLAPSTVKNCKCQCHPGQKTCVCASTLPG